MLHSNLAVRADYFERFMTAERVRGVLVLQDNKIGLEREVATPEITWAAARTFGCRR